MEYIGVITHLLTIDPNFQRDIQVGGGAPVDQPRHASMGIENNV